MCILADNDQYLISRLQSELAAWPFQYYVGCASVAIVKVQLVLAKTGFIANFYSSL